jgi:hypothetical protein
VDDFALEERLPDYEVADDKVATHTATRSTGSDQRLATPTGRSRISGRYVLASALTRTRKGGIRLQRRCVDRLDPQRVACVPSCGLAKSVIDDASYGGP